MLQAEGEAQALATVNAVSRTLDARTLTLQSLETMKALGAGPGTTYIIPAELTRLLASLGGLMGGDTTATPELDATPMPPMTLERTHTASAAPELLATAGTANGAAPE